MIREPNGGEIPLGILLGIAIGCLFVWLFS
jgi:hypothetical protein